VFTETELRQLLFCCAEELRARALGKAPGPQQWLRNLVRRLELEVAVSSSRQGCGDDDAASEHDDWIGTAEAARILRWHPRRVQRLASDLDGRKVSGKLVFSERVVRQYAEGLTDDRATA
jgi:hypothetical protein